MWNNTKIYAIIALLSNRYPATEGGVYMEIITAFLIAVTAGVTCHYVIKWLDSDYNHKDNK